ncbi:MAG: amidohydrolase [Planctomycetes bacterium]|nr:amidohydrolase [Planctomycetota bacterium]
MKNTLLTVCLAVVAFACAAPKPAFAPTERARAELYSNGTVYVGAPEWRRVEALLVRDGRVVFAGERTEALRRASELDVREFDLAGRVLIPGLVDAHGHLEGYGDALGIVDLRGVATFEEVVALVADSATRVPAGTWVRGRGWDQNLWPTKAFPNHQALSAATPNHPVFLERIDGHAALANAKALALAGLDGDVRGRDRMQGGEVLFDGEGRATGVLIDAAMGQVERVIPAPTLDERWARIERATRALVAEGLTAVHDMGVPAELAQRFVERPLALRAFVYVAGNEGIDAALRPMRSTSATSANEVVGVKLMIDGALGSRGAALLADYSDAPGERGHLLIVEARLAELVERCAMQGLQPATHAIGDYGNRAVLDALEKVEAHRPELRELRPRIEHAQIVAPEDWPRFVALGVIPSMQPTHATSDMPWAETRVGSARIAGAYAWKRLSGPSTPLAFGSDFPVEKPNPFEGLSAAITRCDVHGSPVGGWLPEQKLTAREALAAFTTGAAWAVHREQDLGRLAPGYLADFVVIDVDPLACEPSALLATHVLATVVGGEVVYGRLEPHQPAQ